MSGGILPLSAAAACLSPTTNRRKQGEREPVGAQSNETSMWWLWEGCVQEMAPQSGRSTAGSAKLAKKG